MKREPTLSIAPYYGGKGRMAHFIVDRLDYRNTDVFVTPFGGLCRVLLNKHRHAAECYNELNPGLCALMRVLSNPKTADHFIRRVYETTEHSKDEFDRQKGIYDNEVLDLEAQERKKLREMLIGADIVTPGTANSLLDEILYVALENEKDPSHKVSEAVKLALEKLDKWLKESERLRFQMNNWGYLYQLKQEQGYVEHTSNLGETVSDEDLAVATYVVFQQSRDGMGQTFSKEKFNSTDQYKNRVLTLYDCAERLAGLNVFQMEAMSFFRKYAYANDAVDYDNLGMSAIMNEWINNPRVMMYCDPSYIKPEDERRLLKGIDIRRTDNVSDEILKKSKGNLPKNLGKVYARSFGYEDQEAFLRCIQNAKAKIMVSNYDLELYNKYLSPENGWRREEYLTSTSVGGAKGNSRVEVIWYNY